MQVLYSNLLFQDYLNLYVVTGDHLRLVHFDGSLSKLMYLLGYL